MTCKFLLLFGLLSSVLCHASIRQPVFHPLQVEERTRTDFAYCALKDEEGFLWIATDYGLRRYDGYQIRTFLRDENDPNTLGSTGAFSLLLHSSGDLWVGGTMLSRYNADTETFNNFPVAGSTPVLALEEDTEGNIWLGGPGFGLVRFDPVAEKVLDVYFKDEAEGRISDLLMHHSGDALWAASAGGVYLFDFANKKEKKYPLHNEMVSESYVGKLAQDADGKLWVTTNKGLFVLDENVGLHKHYSAESNSKRALKTNKLSAVKKDAKGQIWVGTDKEGVYLYQPKTDDFLHFPPATFTDGMLPPGQIFDIYEDDKDSLWFSVGPYGVYRLSESYEKFATYKNSPEFSNSLSFNNVLGMLEDNQGKVWIATDGGGLNLFDPEEAVFTHYFHDPVNSNSISTNTVLTLDQDENGTIWIGTWGGGLNRFDPKTGTFKRYLRNPQAAKDSALADNNVFDIEVMADGRILLSVWGRGIQIFDPATEKFNTFVEGSDKSKLLNTFVSGIQPSNDGNYWISGYGGVEKYFPEPERVAQIDLATKDGAFNVYEDKNDTLWVATPSGLIRYMPYINNVKQYSTRDGLSDNFVVGVEEDSSGYLWISTRNGLSRFDPETETFEIFDKNDGLASSHFNRGSHLKTRDGHLYFGSTDGLIVFNPQQLPRNEYAPTVHFLGLELFQKPLLQGTSPWLSKPLNRVEHLTLPYDQRDITFLFTALNFINPEKNRFRYRLQGLEEDWLETNSRGRRVRYTNLAPGDYSFQLLSANNDGVWNGSARELKLTIMPAWWQTWWAITVYVGLAILAIYAYGRWQIRQNLQREKQLQLLVDEQTAQLRRANRTVVQINSELEQRVAHRTQELSQEIEDRRESEARVAYIAYHDPLTGLYNRVWLLNHLEELIDSCSKTKYGVFYIGGDRFRKINDMHGPLVGDALLKAASERLRNLVPEDYLTVRLGGDEFAVIIDHYTPDLDAKDLGERICEEFKHKFQIDKLNIAFSVSVGIVIGNGEYTESTHILRDANIAMQSAKEKGRGTCQIFDEKMLEATLENAALENALKNALVNGEFSVVYQPIIAMQSQQLDGFELLLRWTHPDLGMVPPIKFIGIAESLGLIFDIGIWVIRQACLQLINWKELFGEENVPNISVNLSPLQLGQDDLLPLINSVLKETGAPIEKIKLEITESALMLDTGTSDKLLDELRQRGFELAIDDFGTGYSSLSYLDRLPVQILKIDRAFVNALFEEDREAGSAHEIVRATINLAHSLQMRVVAEGIETPQQLETLKTYDCDFGQGYYIAKPMPADKASEFLRNYLDTL